MWTCSSSPKETLFSLAVSLHFSPPSLSPDTTIEIYELEYSGFKQYIVLCDWLLSFRMFPKFIQIMFYCMENQFHLFTHQLLDIGVVSTFGLLWIMLLWPFTYRSLYERTCSILLCVKVGVELLGHMVILCLTFLVTARLLSKVIASPAVRESSNFSASSLILAINLSFDCR